MRIQALLLTTLVSCTPLGALAQDSGKVVEYCMSPADLNTLVDTACERARVTEEEYLKLQKELDKAQSQWSGPQIILVSGLGGVILGVLSAFYLLD